MGCGSSAQLASREPDEKTTLKGCARKGTSISEERTCFKDVVTCDTEEEVVRCSANVALCYSTEESLAENCCGELLTTDGRVSKQNETTLEHLGDLQGQEELSFNNRVEELRRMSVSRHVSLQGTLILPPVQESQVTCASDSIDKPASPLDQQSSEGLNDNVAVTETKRVHTKAVRRISFSAVKAEFLFHVQNESGRYSDKVGLGSVHGSEVSAEGGRASRSVSFSQMPQEFVFDKDPPSTTSSPGIPPPSALLNSLQNARRRISTDNGRALSGFISSSRLIPLQDIRKRMSSDNAQRRISTDTGKAPHSSRPAGVSSFDAGLQVLAQHIHSRRAGSGVGSGGTSLRGSSSLSGNASLRSQSLKKRSLGMEN